MPLVVPFRFSAHHFPHLCPHGKRKRGISNLCAPGIPGKQLSRCQKIRNQVAPRGWRDFWGFNFCWPKKSVALEREGWWRMNLMFHLCFFLKKRKHRRRWLEDLQWMNVAGCLFGRGLLWRWRSMCCFFFWVHEGRTGKSMYVTVVHVWTWKDTSWYSIMTYRLWSLQGLTKYDTSTWHTFWGKAYLFPTLPL